MTDEEFASLHDELITPQVAHLPHWEELDADAQRHARALYDVGRNRGYDDGERDAKAADAAEIQRLHAELSTAMDESARLLSRIEKLADSLQNASGYISGADDRALKHIAERLRELVGK